MTIINDAWLLSLLWLGPLIGSLAVLLIPDRWQQLVRWFALGFMLSNALVSILALVTFLDFETAEPSSADLAARSAIARGEEVETTTRIDPNHDLLHRSPWIPSFGIDYFVGLDGISLSLILLTSLLGILASLASWNVTHYTKGYFSLFLILIATVNGVFLALDLLLFFIFFEFMLLPMYFLIGIWGGPHREFAAIKFLLYTLLGSVFILIGMLFLYFWAPPGVEALATFDIFELATKTDHFDGQVIGIDLQSLIFVLFLIGFLVKLPAFPFHTWLPDAHVQASTPISMLLAGVLLKIGGYGLMRIAWPLAPEGAIALSGTVSVLAVICILYGALAALAQSDFKRLVAYSSVSHMGFVLLGMAIFSGASDAYSYGVTGSLFMMIAHGITSAGMFFLVGVVYERTGTRDLTELGGLMNAMPRFGGVMLLIFFGSMGLPGLCGFVAEVLVLLGTFKYDIGLAVLASSSVVLTAGYILWTIQRVLLGPNRRGEPLRDLTFRETAIAAPLVLFTILLGVLPSSLLVIANNDVDQIVSRVEAASTR